MKNSKLRITTLYTTQAGLLAALYVVLTVVFAPISYGPIQVRISEMLCILPFFTPAAIPGLFIGCFISNFFNPEGFIWADLVFGSLATLIGALGTYFIGKIPARKTALFIAPLPAVLANTLIIPFVLKYGYGVEDGLLFLVGTICLGEIISCMVLGIPLGLALGKLAPKIFGSLKIKNKKQPERQ